MYPFNIGKNAYCINTKMKAMRTSIHSRPIASRSMPLIARVQNVLKQVAARWLERHRTRQKLRHLDDHMLRDIGLTSDAVWNETAKPFWRD